MQLFHKSFLIFTLFGLLFLPACRRVHLKQLPPIPARQENTLFVEARVLNQKETKDHTGISFDKRSPLCAFHVIAYNPTQEELIITSNSWSIKPSSLDDIRPYIRALYYPYIPVGLALGGVVCIGFAGLAFYNFAAAIGLAAFKMGAASNTCCLYALASAGAGTGTFIATPFIIYHVINKKITDHNEALIPQLFPIEGAIPAQTNLQGIVILPKIALKNSWSLQLMDQNNNSYFFDFNTENVYA